MKAYWYVMIPKFNRVSIRKLEYKIGDQIANVYFELSNGKKVVIQFQNSRISKRKLMERTKNYSQKDIYVLWIFNGFGTCVSDKKKPQNKNEIGVRRIEKRVHSLYVGRMYYMNVLGRKIIDSPFVLHFSPFFKHKNSDYNYLGYDKYYKDKQSVTLGRIPNYKILCIESNRYKLARFTDKHLSTLCTEELISCIKEICQKSLLIGKKNHEKIEIPLRAILSHLKERYGFHLPYLLLKKLNKIKKVNIRKFFDDKYNVEELITVQISDYL